MEGKNIVSLEEVTKNVNDPKIEGLCGAKATSLARVHSCGLPIAPGFVITANAFTKYIESGSGPISDELWNEIIPGIRAIEVETKLQYSGKDPLFLSVSGQTPTPGVICVGMNDYTARMLERKTNNRAFAYNSYMRFIKNYGALVHNIPEGEFDELQLKYLESRNLNMMKVKDIDYISLTKLFKSVIVRHSGKSLSQEPLQQLRDIIEASFKNYSNENSTAYRTAAQINSQTGATILVTATQFGARNDKSGAGVISTHELTTGEAMVSGLFANTAFVEDVTEESIMTMPIGDMVRSFPDDWKTIGSKFDSIEKAFKSPVVMEFVIDDGKLAIVTARQAKFGMFSRFTAAVNMVKAKKITENEAITTMSAADFGAILKPTLAKEPTSQLVAGAPGACGVGSGSMWHCPVECFNKAKNGQKCILVKRSVYGSDVIGIIASEAIISIAGGDYSRGAFIARALSKPAAIGCHSLSINAESKTISTASNITASFGDEVTVYNGEVYLSSLPTNPTFSIINSDAAEVLEWADNIRKDKLSILTEVSSIQDAKLSVSAGADGVGMFSIENFLTNDMESIVNFVLNQDDRKEIGVEIENRLSSSFSDLFVAAESQILTIKLLDVPLSQLLPSMEELTRKIAELRVRKEFDKKFNRNDELESLIKQLELAKKVHESNPLMGNHGIRLELIVPELFTLQVRAVLTSAKAAKRRGAQPKPRILLPFLTDSRELIRLESAFKDVMLELDETAELGAMIECPRACLTAEHTAEESSFICIGTDALHETTFGICKADAEDTFLKDYTAWHVLEQSPFASLDQVGAGELMKICVADARKAKADIPIIASGHNCFDEQSVNFCYSIGINSVTCSPEMVPVARLSAAQAILSSNK